MRLNLQQVLVQLDRAAEAGRIPRGEYVTRKEWARANVMMNGLVEVPAEWALDAEPVGGAPTRAALPQGTAATDPIPGDGAASVLTLVAWIILVAGVIGILVQFLPSSSPSYTSSPYGSVLPPPPGPSLGLILTQALGVAMSSALLFGFAAVIRLLQRLVVGQSALPNHVSEQD